MDLNFTARGNRLPRRSASFLPHRRPELDPRQGRGGRGADPRRHDHRPAHPERARLGHGELACGVGRAGLDADPGLSLPGRDAAGELPGADRLQRLHGRPRDRPVRQPGDQAALPAGDRQRRHLLVPGLLRTRLRLRSGVVAHQGREARATSISSTARRPGPRWRNTPTGSSACPHRSRPPRRRRGFRSSWST